MLRTADLDYPLPEELIATTPASPRDAARLMVVSRSDPSRLEHRFVRDLPEILRPPALRESMPPDLMIVNSTRVLPARFKGVRTDTGGHVEGLYLGSTDASPAGGGDATVGWTVLLKMRRMKPGVRVRLFDRSGSESDLHLRLVERAGDSAGAWHVAVEHEGPACNPAHLLDRIGLTPVPPYILASRRRTHLEVPDDLDRSTYQTVYAATNMPMDHGSVAAPTAGLHFTPELLARLKSSRVERAEVFLDVSLGTFKPVETEFVEQHPMHSEWCQVPRETAEMLRSSHGRVIAVGTTAARTLESFVSTDEMLREHSMHTRLLITPGYAFKHIDALLTNFHLPQSTLLAMVAAFLAPPTVHPINAEIRQVDSPSGIDRVKAIYAEAIREQYRFYSFGDAMLVLP